MLNQKTALTVSTILKSFSQQKFINIFVKSACINSMQSIKIGIVNHVVINNQKPYLMALFMQALSIFQA